MLQEVLPDGSSSPLRETLVVLIGADAVGMALYRNLIARVLLDKPESLLELGGVRIPDNRLIEVEIDMNGEAVDHLGSGRRRGHADRRGCLAGAALADGGDRILRRARGTHLPQPAEIHRADPLPDRGAGASRLPPHQR